MPVLTIEYRDERERLGLEQAIAFFTQMRQVAQTAPDGTVLAACEQVALRDGPALLRAGLTAAVQGRIEAAERKGGPPARGLRVRPRRPLQGAARASRPDRRRADRRGAPVFHLPGLRSRRFRGRPRVGPGRLPDRRRPPHGLPGRGAAVVRPGRDVADGSASVARRRHVGWV